jgi:hypothetical protein
VVTVPQQNEALLTHCCSRAAVSDPHVHLQKQKLDLEIENLTLRNKLLRLQIKRIEGAEEISEC